MPPETLAATTRTPTRTWPGVELAQAKEFCQNDRQGKYQVVYTWCVIGVANALSGAATPPFYRSIHRESILVLSQGVRVRKDSLCQIKARADKRGAVST